MITREAFLRALEANEDDVTMRLVYSDWLEERGETEEAERQRAWPAAKEWLVKFYEENWEKEKAQLIEWDLDPNEVPEEWPGSIGSYKDMMRQATEAADGGFEYMNCGNSEWLCDALREHRTEFWKKFCIVAGYRLPEDMEDKGHFSCAC
jgi:uncharacterized protein (TIGR02996 family)